MKVKEKLQEKQARKKKKHKSKGYRTRYAGSRGKGVVVTLPFDPRKGVCQACKKSKKAGEIKSTHLHHWRYAYQPKTVKKNPLLAIENTGEYCFYCHQLADGLRALLTARPIRIAWVAKTLKGRDRKKLIKILEAIINELEKTEKNINNLAQNILEMAGNAKEYY